MFERFTDRARRVVVLAQEEARMLSHNYIGTEHILLGLIHEGEGVAAKALESLDISLEAVRAQDAAAIKALEASHTEGSAAKREEHQQALAEQARMLAMQLKVQEEAQASAAAASLAEAQRAHKAAQQAAVEEHGTSMAAVRAAHMKKLHELEGQAAAAEEEAWQKEEQALNDAVKQHQGMLSAGQLEMILWLK